jgi:hypothetical protein
MGNSNPNPLDACTRSFMQCDNPCKTEPGTCPELLPTQVDTFITQFFGTVGKSDSGGSVAWSLPCGLDTGIGSNPRLPGESVACYFLRLFEAGLVGSRGLPGHPGIDGAAGPDAFSFVRQGFPQPSAADPYISVLLNPSASLVQGLFYQIENSGWYQLQNINSDGTALLVFLQSVPGAIAVIPEGSIVVASGMPGIRVQGPQGQKGDTGLQGPKGLTGIKGLPGSQGPQGATVALNAANSLSKGTWLYGMGNSYTDWNVLNSPQVSLPASPVSRRILMIFQLFVFVVTNSGVNTVNGAMFTKLDHYVGGFGGLVDGTERVVNFTGRSGFGFSKGVNIALIADTTPNQTDLWIPASYSGVAGGLSGFSSFFSSGSSALWMQIQ